MRPKRVFLISGDPHPYKPNFESIFHALFHFILALMKVPGRVDDLLVYQAF